MVVAGWRHALRSEWPFIIIIIIIILSTLLLAFVVGGLGFEFSVFVAGWRHALRSEWPFIIIINNMFVGAQVLGDNLSPCTL